MFSKMNPREDEVSELLETLKQDEIVDRYINSDLHLERKKTCARNKHKKNDDYFEYKPHKSCKQCETSNSIYFFRVLSHYRKEGWQIFSESEACFMFNGNIFDCFIVIDLYLCEECMKENDWETSPVMKFSTQ